MRATIGGRTDNGAWVDTILRSGAVSSLFSPGARREVVNVNYVKLGEGVVTSATDSDEDAFFSPGNLEDRSIWVTPLQGSRAYKYQHPICSFRDPSTLQPILSNIQELILAHIKLQQTFQIHARCLDAPPFGRISVQMATKIKT